MVLVGSINVNGLRNEKKKKKKKKNETIFHWLNTKSYDITLLQETHCSNSEEELKWVNEWERTGFWSHGTRMSKGVSILISKCFNLQLISSKNPEDGRIIAIKLKIHNINAQIINVYVPCN